MPGLASLGNGSLRTFGLQTRAKRLNYTTLVISNFSALGGGGGGGAGGGGGGSGGLRISNDVSVDVSSPNTYVVIVGGGGNGGTGVTSAPGQYTPANWGTAGNGGNTGCYQQETGANLLPTITSPAYTSAWAVGGGRGAGTWSTAEPGGSGGGGSGNYYGTLYPYNSGKPSVQDNPQPAICGAGAGGAWGDYQSGGGGGWLSNGGYYDSGSGVSPSPQGRLAGGSGTVLSVFGGTVAAGGGGGAKSGSGSGGTAYNSPEVTAGSGSGWGGNAENAIPNRGGGGGGSGFENSGPNQYCAYNGGNGGSGQLVIQFSSFYDDAITTGNPTFTDNGTTKTYKFTGSGSITFRCVPK